MPTRRDFVAGGALAAATALRAESGAPAPDDRPNLLFVMTDQQFADAMSCRMGDRWLHTPNMDALAANGMLFSRAYSANPLCMPLRASLFTGRYPHETRVTHNAKPKGGVDPKEFVCMGTYLREAGYETGYSGKWHLCFNQKDESEHGFEILRPAGGDNYDAKVTDGAVRFLARDHKRPFALVVSYLNPHNICQWSRRLAGRKQELNCGEIGDPPPLDQLPPPPANLEIPRHEPDGMTVIRKGYHASQLFPVGDFTPEDWRKDRWGYYRMIEKVDGELGKVLAALRETGQEENTLIVFTSDHGDCAGAHRFNQKTVFYDESSRVPLIVSWKGRTPAGTSGKLVNTGIDVLPTLLDCAGVEIPAKLPGRSLLPLSLGRRPETWRDHVVIQNDMCQTGEVDGFKPEMEGRMVRTDRYKYCIFSRGQQRESLVDMQSDPGEMVDLATDPKHRDTLLAHRELLARFGREHNDPLVAELLADGVKPIPFGA